MTCELVERNGIQLTKADPFGLNSLPASIDLYYTVVDLINKLRFDLRCSYCNVSIAPVTLGKLNINANLVLSFDSSLCHTTFITLSNTADIKELKVSLIRLVSERCLLTESKP